MPTLHLSDTDPAELAVDAIVVGLHAGGAGGSTPLLAPGAESQVSLAVRSSATAEDSTAFSFAGLHDTILDVCSREGLDAAIRRCWASLQAG